MHRESTHERVQIAVEMMHYAQKAYPRECAGLIVRTKAGSLATVPSPEGNASTHHYELPAELFWAVRQSSQTIVAFYHSHPSGCALLSDADQESMLIGEQLAWPGVDWYIVPVTRTRVEQPVRYRWSKSARRFVRSGDNACN